MSTPCLSSSTSSLVLDQYHFFKEKEVFTDNVTHLVEGGVGGKFVIETQMAMDDMQKN
jgi:hypothetical protein